MSETEIEPTELAAKIAAQLLEVSLVNLSGRISDLVKRAKVTLGIGFTDYIHATLKRCENVKTITHPDETVPLKSIYVPLTFESNRKCYSDARVLNHFKSKQRLLIVGTAGGGKSIFLRHVN